MSDVDRFPFDIYQNTNSLQEEAEVQAEVLGHPPPDLSLDPKNSLAPPPKIVAG